MLTCAWKTTCSVENRVPVPRCGEAVLRPQVDWATEPAESSASESSSGQGGVSPKSGPV
jgi:hypothetical protein